MQDKLFIYGTLHPDRAPDEIADVVRRFERMGKGTIRGRLHDLGKYPAVVLDQAGDVIEGEVFTLPQDPNAIRRLDVYEEYRPADPDGSLFTRRKTTVKLANGSEEQCWVYVYNRPLPLQAA